MTNTDVARGGAQGMPDPNDCELNQSSLESDSELEEALGKILPIYFMYI